ncbi:hypothetical protein RD792_003494 [Penstemon davidsonii]|uniref:Carboxypeptidase n=1 Tax=Penstemon davidsonii TaxID=160366 RepID=A0ABR0DUE6_9LAMI|nr:hypothetical protein RD792_003494 [Penstemon davidsonii]
MGQKLGDMLKSGQDNPVGTGYSFVEDTELLVKTDEEAANDLTTLLIKVFNRNMTLQKSPLYIVAESYGGKFAVTLGLSALKAIEAGKLKLKLGGIALGDTWISPEDFVDFYNFLLDSGMDPVSLTASELSQQIAIKRYSRYLNSFRSTPGGEGDLDSLMNGEIKKKLKIIPRDVSWGGQADLVFTALEGDFMKPRINEVDELLAKGVNVTVYNGQLDVICSTKGTEAWVEKLKWDGIKTFLDMKRTPIYCGDEKITKGYTKSYKNLHFYWILGAGHFVSQLL